MDTIATEALKAESLSSPLRFAFGLAGLIVAALGLALGVMQPHITEAMKPPPPPPPQKMADVLAEAGDKFVGKMVDRVRGKKPEPPKAVEPPPKKTPWPLYISIAATSLGLAGSLSGTVGWIRREDLRLTVSAMAIGALAVAWIYIVLGIVIGAAIAILLMLLSALHGG
jgi:hypothetical protein